MLPVLDGNDYRKRVLAPIEARGGMDQTDPFEVYDLPLESVDQLTDAQVRARMDQIWALWQKQRDHPKYRGLVTALLESHEHSLDKLSTAPGRRAMAQRAAAFRQERDGARFATLDAAVRRLVDRFGGLPRGKVEGLRSLAAASGIGPADFEARIRRFRLVDDSPGPAPAPPPADLSAVYRQIRADLDELGQLDSEPPPATLYAFIGLPPGAAAQRVRAQRDALAAHNRTRRPDRRRALVDDLLTAVTAVLVEGDADAYLDAVARDAAAALRPRVAAAILVEDRLAPADHSVLLGAAEEAGLDRARAVRLIAELAGEHGVVAPPAPPPVEPPPSVPLTPSVFSVPSVPSAPTVRPAQPVSAAAWQEELARARAALRAAMPVQAQGHVNAARMHAGQMLPPIRAVDDEVAQRLAEARASWAAAQEALSAGRLAEALGHVEQLAGAAADVPAPDGQLPTAALAQLRARVAEQAPQPATALRAQRVPGGVLLSWIASPSTGEVVYRVMRREADGATRVLGRTTGTQFETAAPDGALPEYLVVARRGGVDAEPASTAAPAPAAPQQAPAPNDPPADAARDLVATGGMLTWTWPDGCDEVAVVYRVGADPDGPHDPQAFRRRVTRARYEADGGLALPPQRPLHVAVHGCSRVDGRVVVDPVRHPTAAAVIA